MKLKTVYLDVITELLQVLLFSPFMCYGIVSEEEKKIYQEKSNKKNIFKKLKRYFFGNRKICNTENYYDEDDMCDDEITDINDYINNYEDNLENIEGTVKIY